MLKKTFKTAAAALAITVGVTSISVSSAQATMSNHNGGHSRHSGHSSSGTAIAIGVLGALAIMSAVQQAQQAKPAYVKRRCAQYTEWRKLMKNAKNNARVQLARGDTRGANSWLRSARSYAAKADAARRDCKNW